MTAKRVVFLVGLLTGLWASPAQATITVQCSAKGSASSGTSKAVDCTAPSAPVSGDQIAVFVFGGSAFDPSNAGTSVADNQGNGAYTRRFYCSNNNLAIASNGDTSVWTVQTGTVTGTFTVTVTANTDSYFTVMVVAVHTSASWASPAINQSTGQPCSSGSSGTATAAMGATTVANTITIGGATTGTNTLTSSFGTELQNQAAGANITGSIEYQINSSTGTYQPTWTFTSDIWSAGAIAYGEAGAVAAARRGPLLGVGP